MCELINSTVELVQRGFFNEANDFYSFYGAFGRLADMMYNLKSTKEPDSSTPNFDEVLLKSILKYVKLCRSLANPKKGSLFNTSFIDNGMNILYRAVYHKKISPSFFEITLELIENLTFIHRESPLIGSPNLIFLMDFLIRGSSRDFLKANLELNVKSLFYDEESKSITETDNTNPKIAGLLNNYFHTAPDVLIEVIFRVGEITSDNLEEGNNQWKIKLKEGQGSIPI
jgi:hypothetical protein